MAFCSSDWRCIRCGNIVWHVAQYSMIDGEKPPSSIVEYCEQCQEMRDHEKVLSMPAPYMGERVCNPMVNGGRYDTVGNRKLAPLPEIPRECDNVSSMKDFFNQGEYRESKKLRETQKAENQMKQRRANLIRKGENINMKHDKLPGDPKISS